LSDTPDARHLFFSLVRPDTPSIVCFTLMSRLLSFILFVVCLNLPGRAESQPGDPNMTFPVPTAAQLDSIAAMLPAKPIGVGRPITDRTAWAEAAKQPYFQKQVTDAATYATQPIPVLTDELFYEILKTGKMDNYQKPYVMRSTRLNAFVVAECIQNRGTYLPLIEAELHAILTEKTWVVPVHVVWNQLPDGPDRAVELASAARAWTVATTDYMLGDKLKPETRQSIRKEMKRRVFDDYEASMRSGKPLWWWMTVKSNWNAVCTAGVLGAALTLIDSPQERALFVQAAQNELSLYMEGITDDGYCYEGVGYWSYGYGNYLRAAEMLYEQTQGKINLFAGARQRQAALFLPHLRIIPGVWPAYGDAYPKTAESVALKQLIDQRWNMGWTDIDASKSDMTAPGALGDNLSGFGLFGFPGPDFGPPPGSPPSPEEAKAGDKRFFFKDASVLVCRAIQPDKPPFGMSVKGGHDGLPHGHNDNGSYVVGYGDFPLLLDPGMEQYTANTFGKLRYTSMMMNSYGHDVPYVGKTLQKGGIDSLGKIVSTTFTDDKDTLVMDLTTGYSVPGMVHLIRTYIFDRTAPSVEVDDDAEFSQPTDYGTALVTISSWKEIGPGSFLIYDKNFALAATMTMQNLDAGTQIVNKVEPITGFRLFPSIHPTRLGVNLNRPVTHVLLKTLIVPASLPPASAQ
jgi:hypothetical protein